jgi:hypothetical protein
MRSRWLVSVTAYTVAGAISSALVGAAAGVVGHALLPAEATVPGTVAAIAVGLLGLARTLGVRAIPFPQPTRQTSDVWVKRWPPTLAAIGWGFDLGLVYTTRFTFPGIWFLTIVAVVARSPGFGAGLFAAYWIGRAGSVWLGPALMRDARETPELLEAVQAHSPLIEKTHVAALVMGVAVLTIAVGTGGGLWPA